MTIIRIKKQEITKIINNNSIFVYYYDEKDDSLLKVSTEIQENNGEKAFITKGDNNSQNDEGYHIQIKLNIKYNRNTNVEMKVMW